MKDIVGRRESGKYGTKYTSMHYLFLEREQADQR